VRKNLINRRIQVENISKIMNSSVIKKINETSNRIYSLVGAILAGIGWGVGGIDILAYFMHSAIFTVPVVIIFGGIFNIGNYDWRRYHFQ
jgi:hypothetical protein